jgi:Zn-dependent protease
MITATVCVYAAPPHQPPPPPPTPAQIPAPPAPQPTVAPPAPISQPSVITPSSYYEPATPESLPTPASLPPPPPGVVIIPTIPSINPTTAPINDNSGSDSSNLPAPSSTNIPQTSQPTANPTSLQTLVIPTNPVAPGQTQTSPTQGASAGPAAGGGGGFSMLVEPTETPVALEEPSGQGVGEPEQASLPAEQDSLKSSPVEIPSSGKETKSEVTSSTTDSSDILSTLRSTARNATATTPVSGLVPPPLVPAVAVTTGMAIALLWNILWANADKIFDSKLFSFLRDFMGENVLQRVDEYETKKRSIGIRAAGRTAIGLTHSEILVVIAGALLIGIASLVALRASFEVNTILLYVITGGVAVTVHEMGHRYAAHHQDVKTEVKFWELGTIIMFFTGWLAGNVFAQPHRTIMEESEVKDHSREAKISLAGPATSICLAVLTVPFLFVGGDITRIASTLIMMSLLIALYHLMPFTPMDGKEILHWNRNLLIVILIPLMVIYYYLFLL